MRDWHTNVAKALLENWQVADEIVDAVSGHEDMDREVRGPVTLTDVLSLATLLRAAHPHGALKSTPRNRCCGRSSACRSAARIARACIDESAEEIAALKTAFGG